MLSEKDLLSVEVSVNEVVENGDAEKLNNEKPPVFEGVSGSDDAEVFDDATGDADADAVIFLA